MANLSESIRLKNVNATSLACLLIATPTLAFGDPEQAKEWLGAELREHWAQPSAEPQAPRSWAVARVLAGDPLLQTRPIVRDQDNSLESEILRDMTHCTIAAHRYLPTKGSQRPVVACRYPQWAGVCVADDLVARWSEQPQEREQLKDKLPDFLRRELPGKRSEALLFFASLAALFAKGQLSPPRNDAPGVLEALDSFRQDLEEISPNAAPSTLWITEGRMLYVLHQGDPLALCLGPKPDRSAQHTLRHKAREGAPSVLLTTTRPDAPLPEGATRVEAKVFALDSHRPAQLLLP